MIGVLLVNMGGPASRAELKQFLRLMFLDKHIIPAPKPIRKFLSWYISNTRSKSSWERYKLVGGTPVKSITSALAERLQHELGDNFRVVSAYSYSKPFIADALSGLSALGVSPIIVVPLYPQSSYTTTASVRSDVKRTLIELPGVKVKLVPEFYKHPLFIKFWKGAITTHINKHGCKSPFLLFSAHSLPLSVIQKGDTYQKATEESARLIAECLGLEYRVSYQSAMKSSKWLGPATSDELMRLSATGEKEIVIIPISFVCENLETLYDLDKQIVPLGQKNTDSAISRVRIDDESPVFLQMLKEMIHEHDQR